MLKHSDNKEIEVQISTMLEKVLDCDEETQTESPKIPMRNMKNPKFVDESYATEAPRLLFVGQPKFEVEFQQLEDPLDSFLKKHEFRDSPQSFHEGNKQYTQLRQFMNKMPHSQNNKSNEASLTESTKSSYERMDSRKGSQISRNSKLNSSGGSGSGTYLNEVFEDLLENRVKIGNSLDEEAHSVLQGNYFNVLCSQVGSRIIQKVLPHTSPYVISMIYQEIDQFIPHLMIDSYANYFCQKFFSFLNEVDKLKFLRKLKENFVEIGNSKIGTYPLQSIIDQLHSEPEKKIIIEAVREKVLFLCLNAQGTHVIEKMLNLFEEWRLQHIYETIIKNFLFLTNNSNGLCVIKKIIAKAQTPESQFIIRNILSENSMTLVQNPYGNYAIQAALESWSTEFCFPIVENFFGHFYSLSLQKYSSNVIEKSFDDERVAIKFVEEMFRANISDIMKHSYGNYVVQRALKAVKGTNKITFAKYLQKNIPLLHDAKLMKKWQTIITNSLLLGVTSLDLNNLNYTGMPNYKSNVPKPVSSHMTFSGYMPNGCMPQTYNSPYVMCQNNNGFVSNYDNINEAIGSKNSFFRR